MTLQELDLADTIAALRSELAAAMQARGEFSFPVEGVSIEVHVGVRREVEGRGGIRFWVVELGGAGRYQREEVQKLTITFGPPAGDDGRPIRINRDYDEMP